jgi:AbrB family looped-hinge helix DNA binding protein
MKAVHARVTESGRLSLPVEFRRALGLEGGGNVVVELEDHEIRIRSLDEAIARSQALARKLLEGRPDASVDAFLAERRREVERE